jgi:iron complex outermembrane receptor protein
VNRQIVVGVSVALALLGSTADAQSSDPSAAETAAPGLEEIIVTAQRREESLQKAAVPVSAVSGETLRDSGIFKPTELSALFPSLQISTSAGPYNLFYLRGVGNFNGNALSDAAVAFNVDGVYLGRPSSTSGFFYDLERIEVVKGPQGTLYGRNATGGAINVITHAADLNELSGGVSAEVGNYDALRFDGFINVPLGEIAAVRAAAVYAEHDGYMESGGDDQEDTAGRLAFQLAPSDDFNIGVVADFFRQRGIGPDATPVALGVDNRDGIESTAGQAFYASQPNLLLGRTFYPISVDLFQDNEYWGISSTVEWSTAIGTLTVIPAYRKGEIDYANLAAGFYIRQQEDDEQTSIEARFATPEDNALRALIGVYYFDEDIEDPLVVYNHQSNGSYQSLKTGTESQAVFGRLTYALRPELRFTIGARYTSEDKDFEGALSAPSRICVFPACPDAPQFPYEVFTPPPPDFDPLPDGTITVPSSIDNTGPNAQDASFSKTTYRGAVDWDITDDNLLYVSYETGFKAGGFFFSTDTGVYKPEEIEAWTLGSKNRFLDDQLQLNVELFDWRYEDQQISHLGIDSAGIAIFPTENVGRSTMRGIELESLFLLTPDTQLSADVQYLDAEYDEFVYTKPNFNGGFSNGTGCPNVGVPGLFYTVDCSGERPPNAPEWTINVGAQQTFALGSGARIVGSLRAHYQTETLTGLEFTADEMQESYTTLDALLTYSSAADRFSVSAFVNNATDETVKSEAFPAPFSLFTTAILRPPRTYGMRIGVRF